MQGERPRFYVLDLVRGLAVFLMILAHAVYFFHNRSNQLLLGAESAGNIFCFMAFLLVSGATAYVSYLHLNFEKRSARLMRRLLWLLISYYAIALFVVSGELMSVASAGKLLIIFDILTLRNLPSYTEYIIPFIFYPFLLLLFGRQVLKITGSIIKILAVSILLYLLGYGLYRLNVPNYLVPWKSLFAGGGELYRFPILQYAPLYLIGLYWGKELVSREGLKKKSYFVFNSALIALGILLFVYLIANSSGFSAEALMRRWPPSPFFILVGIFLTFVSAYLFYISRRLNYIPILRDFLLVIGQNAYALFWSHIFLLSGYSLIGGVQTGSILMFIIIFIVFWLLCFSLAIVLPFNFKFALNFYKYSHEDAEEYWQKSRLNKLEGEVASAIRQESRIFTRYFLPKDNGTKRRKKLIGKRHLILGLLIGLSIAAFSYPAILDEAKTYLKRNNAVPWWDESYAFRQNIIINNLENFTEITAGKTVELTFDHQSLVSKGIARRDGNDVRILYWDGSSYQDLPVIFENGWNRNDTKIVFPLVKSLAGGRETSDYYLYFGNFSVNRSNKDLSLDACQSKYSIKLSKIVTGAVSVKLNKRWILIGEDEPVLNFTAHANVDFSDPLADYQIIGTDISGTVLKNGEEFSGGLPINNLKPGTYQLQLTVKDGEKTYNSALESFFISYPLYIAWTEDWEGYDTQTSYLNAMSKISKDYNIPMTHFFNPRTLTTQTIPSDRKTYLKNYLQDRLKSGDALAMHLHMFYDFVQASGVTPKTEPRWDSGNDGYNVPTTAYDRGELEKIISYGLEVFQAQGWQKPDIYRAGGWFANTETLAALDDLGFSADSSGRSAYKFGKNQIPGFWDLEATTVPYQPSQSNQNISSVSNPFNLLEIPNNGADSYWFSAEDMINRFRQNFSGSVLKSPQQITYLSHPHWFRETEQNKIRSLFDYISQYRNDEDFGPVIFTTSEEILKEWTN